MSTGDWNLVFGLPNLAPPERSLGTSTLVVPAENDGRLLALIEREPNVGRFLSAFVDEYGSASGTAALLSRSERPRLEAVYAFRDSLAFSVIAGAMAIHINFPPGIVGLLFSNYFRFHPTTLGRGDDAVVVTQTQALRGLEALDDFKGRVDPALPVGTLSHSRVDHEIYLRLLRLWNIVCGQGTAKHSARSRAVFRALNVAFEAASLPHNHLALDRDLGVRLALWISAFEILVWPINRKAGFEHVTARLEAHDWQHKGLRAARYKLVRNKKMRRVPLPIRIYELMYRARNTYLHGEQIRERHLYPFASGESLLAFAPLLFRVVLDTILPKLRHLRASELEYMQIQGNRPWRLLRAGYDFDIERAIVAATKPLPE